LFDHGTQRTLARHLIDHHTLTEAPARGWERVSNGELLTLAEAAGFEVRVTTDKNFSISRTVRAGRSRLSCWGMVNIFRQAARSRWLFAAVNAAPPGSYAEVEVPTT